MKNNLENKYALYPGNSRENYTQVANEIQRKVHLAVMLKEKQMHLFVNSRERIQ